MSKVEYNIKGIKLPLVEKICREKLNQYTSDIEKLFHLENKIHSLEHKVNNVDDEYICGCPSFEYDTLHTPPTCKHCEAVKIVKNVGYSNDLKKQIEIEDEY